MDSVLFIQLSLLCTSLTLAIIFFMAWQTMGRQKYTLIWAITFLVMAVQRLFNIFQEEFDSHTLYWMIVCALSVLSVTLGAWGHLLRTETNWNTRYLHSVGVFVLVATYYFTEIEQHRGLSTSIYVFHNAIMLFAIGIVIWRYRPTPLPAEVGAALSYLILSVFQFLSASFALFQGKELDQAFWDIYILLNFVSLPAAFTAMGLFVVFILASDLADKMKTLAMTDSLTNSLNRRGFYEQAQQKIAEMLKKSHFVCLIYWDIDRFKRINDTHGHAAGDTVLIETVEQVRANIKHEDLLGRLGGEEFVILLGRADLDAATEVAERLRNRIEQTPIYYKGQAIKVTASFGVVLIDEDKHVTVERAINSADKALYQAKSDGRNQVVVASAVAVS